MPFCSKCGYKVLDGELFCEKCGTKIRINSSDSSNSNNQKRNVVFEGDLHKCPNCGATVQSFELNCKTCGYEFRNTSTSDSLKQLEKKIRRINDNNITSEKEKMNKIENLLSSFSIPNTKEDMYEFATLAAANVQPEMLSGYSPWYIEEDEYNDYKQYSEAWYSKFKQVYNKAELAMTNPNDFSIIQKLHDKLEKQIKCAKTEGKKKAKIQKANKRKQKKFDAQIKYKESETYIKEKAESRSTIIEWIPRIVFPLVLILVMCWWCFSYEDSKKAKENETITQIRELESKGQFDKALELAEELSTDGQENREKRIDMINEVNAQMNKNRISKHISTGKMVEVPEKPSGFKGENYKDVIRELETAGFKYIATEMLPDIEWGFFTDVGDVERVSINGKTGYGKGDEFPEEAEVVVVYHVDS